MARARGLAKPQWLSVLQLLLLHEGVWGLLQPWQLKAKRTPRGKKVTWIHLHNHGGTTIWQQAKHQGEICPNERQNAFVNLDRCSTPPGSSRVHCRERVNASYTFSMIERDIDESDLECEDMLVGIMIRDPVAAMRSTIVHDSFDVQAILGTLRTGVDMHSRHAPDAFDPEDLCLPPWDTYQHFDNFMTRSLGDGYTAPPRGVTRSHLGKAKERLQRMHVVIVLEELQQHILQLNKTFHWRLGAELRGAKMPVGNKHEADALAAALRPSEIAILRKMNALDYELYAYARQLAARRTLAAAWK
mmetsp:Transcript_3419/g.7873  ORF Transcript_3419/g.7873 Transcript_3419/m.7873 type:complete len:302 (-) Transcript_3419:70-975(-)